MEEENGHNSWKDFPLKIFIIVLTSAFSVYVSHETLISQLKTNFENLKQQNDELRNRLHDHEVVLWRLDKLEAMQGDFKKEVYEKIDSTQFRVEQLRNSYIDFSQRKRK